MDGRAIGVCGDGRKDVGRKRWKQKKAQDNTAGTIKKRQAKDSMREGERYTKEENKRENKCQMKSRKGMEHENRRHNRDH